MDSEKVFALVEKLRLAINGDDVSPKDFVGACSVLIAQTAWKYTTSDAEAEETIKVAGAMMREFLTVLQKGEEQ